VRTLAAFPYGPDLQGILQLGVKRCSARLRVGSLRSGARRRSPAGVPCRGVWRRARRTGGKWGRNSTDVVLLLGRRVSIRRLGLAQREKTPGFLFSSCLSGAGMLARLAGLRRRRVVSRSAGSNTSHPIPCLSFPTGKCSRVLKAVKFRRVKRHFKREADL